MPKPTLPAFDPADLAESNATSYPEKFRAANSGRWNRRLGDHVGLTNFGVNLTRIVPGAQSSARHAHSRQDEFIWVVRARSCSRPTRAPRSCGPACAPASRPAAATPIASSTGRPPTPCCWWSATARRSTRSAYPDIDNHAKAGADGRYVHTRKDGTPH